MACCVIYNLPIGLCIKRKYMTLLIMISSPRKPNNDINVFVLSPLIDDLKLLWDDEVEVFDDFANEYFQMHAMLFLYYERLSCI